MTIDSAQSQDTQAREEEEEEEVMATRQRVRQCLVLKSVDRQTDRRGRTEGADLSVSTVMSCSQTQFTRQAEAKNLSDSTSDPQNIVQIQQVLLKCNYLVSLTRPIDAGNDEGARGGMLLGRLTLSVLIWRISMATRNVVEADVLVTATLLRDYTSVVMTVNVLNIVSVRQLVCMDACLRRQDKGKANQRANIQK